MRPFSLRFAAAALAALAALGIEARTVTDDNGERVEVPERIERVAVANVLPLASALTVYTGNPKLLVGMHPASMSAAKAGLLGELYPEVLKADTGFIQGANLNVEALLGLAPDVVLVNAADRRMIAQVKAAGLTPFAVSPTKWRYDVVKTYAGWMASLAELFPEVPARAAAIGNRTREIEALVRERTADLRPEERARILFLVRCDDRQIVTSGRNFFGEYWARAVGALNAAHDLPAENSNALLSMEAVYGYDPDLILITNFTAAQPADLYENRIAGHDWSDVKAVREKRVFKMPLGIYRSFTPSADTPLTLLWMAKTVYPTRFADIDLTAEVKRWYRDAFGIGLTDAQAERIFNPSAEGSRNASLSVRTNG